MLSKLVSPSFLGATVTILVTIHSVLLTLERSWKMYFQIWRHVVWAREANRNILYQNGFYNLFKFSLITAHAVVVQPVTIFRNKFKSINIKNSKLLSRITVNVIFPATYQTAREITNGDRTMIDFILFCHCNVFLMVRSPFL